MKRAYQMLDPKQRRAHQQEAVLDYLTGPDGVDKVGKRYHVTGATVSQWVRDYCLAKNPESYKTLMDVRGFTTATLKVHSDVFTSPGGKRLVLSDKDKIAGLMRENQRLRRLLRESEQSIERLRKPVKKDNWLKRLVYAI